LIGIERFGIDNWAEIGDFLGNKTPRQCELHYYAFYYTSKEHKSPTPNMIITQREPDGSYLLNQRRWREGWERKERLGALREEGRSKEEEVAPRITGEENKASKQTTKEATRNPTAGGSEPGVGKHLLISTSHQLAGSGDVIGYMPLRGDFNVEYDNDAELILADMEFAEDDTKSDTDLKFEVLRLYNAKLDERIRRKKFIIDKGLVDIRNIMQEERQMSKEEREVYSLLRPFRRFCEGDEYKRLADALLYERVLQQRLDALRNFKYLVPPPLGRLV
jgi:transcriptional adapter 2-alpha